MLILTSGWLVASVLFWLWLGARVTPLPDGENLETLRRVLQSEARWLECLEHDVPAGPNTDLADPGHRILVRAAHLDWLRGRIEKGRKVHSRDLIA